MAAIATKGVAEAWLGVERSLIASGRWESPVGAHVEERHIVDSQSGQVDAWVGCRAVSRSPARWWSGPSGRTSRASPGSGRQRRVCRRMPGPGEQDGDAGAADRCDGACVSEVTSHQLLTLCWLRPARACSDSRPADRRYRGGQGPWYLPGTGLTSHLGADQGGHGRDHLGLPKMLEARHLGVARRSLCQARLWEALRS